MKKYNINYDMTNNKICTKILLWEDENYYCNCNHYLLRILPGLINAYFPLREVPPIDIVIKFEIL